MRTFTINARKYDQKIRKSWRCSLVEQVGSMLVLSGEFDEDIAHPGLGSIARGTVSREHYWLDRWYNVFHFSEPDGKFRNFYCNVAMPAQFAGETLDYVDLDIDLIVWPDGTVETLDEDDFAANTQKFKYSKSIQKNALSAVAELQHLIENRQFPFDIESQSR